MSNNILFLSSTIFYRHVPYAKVVRKIYTIYYNLRTFVPSNQTVVTQFENNSKDYH